LFITPQISHGYWTTSQHAIKIGDNNVLYLVQYKFGLNSQSVDLPIGAVRTMATGSITSPYVNYGFVEDGETIYTGGTAAALVISDAEIKNNQYHLKAGQSGTFTLLTLLTLTPEELVDNPDLALQVTHLPFIRTTDTGNVYTDQLNISELSNYVTPEVDM
ncbi:hypothetical protein KC851_00920, partial [Candidatus Kaiserbacteria bacterium]|nr:hypothetical protein [Candidatus Kaiserbacteria bacterium]